MPPGSMKSAMKIAPTTVLAVNPSWNSGAGWATSGVGAAPAMVIHSAADGGRPAGNLRLMETGFVQRRVRDRGYTVYVPEAFQPRTSPAILFLHGRGESGT